TALARDRDARALQDGKRVAMHAYEVELDAGDLRVLVQLLQRVYRSGVEHGGRFEVDDQGLRPLVPDHLADGSHHRRRRREEHRAVDAGDDDTRERAAVGMALEPLELA